MGENKEKEIDRIMDMLDSISKEYKTYQGMPDYIKMAECTSELLDVVFGIGKYSLPIDIDAVLKYLGIQVVETKLNDNTDSDKRSNRVVGQLSIHPQIFGSGTTKCIYIDSEATLYTQRYALAHELGHYLINENRKLFNDEYCIMPMLPRKAEELVADAFAVSLLIPIKVFIRKFDIYISEERQKGNLPISTEDWLQYLSTSARVSYHYVACGYQQLRCVAFWLYQHWRDEKKLTAGIDMTEEEQRKTEADFEKRKQKYTVLTENLDEILSEQIVDNLFQ